MLSCLKKLNKGKKCLILRYLIVLNLILNSYLALVARALPVRLRAVLRVLVVHDQALRALVVQVLHFPVVLAVQDQVLRALRVLAVRALRVHRPAVLCQAHRLVVLVPVLLAVRLRVVRVHRQEVHRQAVHHQVVHRRVVLALLVHHLFRQVLRAPAVSVVQAQAAHDQVVLVPAVQCPVLRVLAVHLLNQGFLSVFMFSMTIPLIINFLKMSMYKGGNFNV